VRLLFDEQLSEELVTALHDLFPDSLHVRLLGKGGAADPISVLRGAPPKVMAQHGMQPTAPENDCARRG
jgi:hypothetical protein